MANSSATGKLSLHHALSYTGPYIMMVWLASPITILQGVYAKYYGVSLTTLASILLICRLFDAISDPLIGYCSDRYRQRNGTRKPFVFAGGLLLIVSCYFLYVPTSINSQGISTAEPSASITATYLLMWFLMFYMSQTLFEISHSAWASELAPTATDKSKIFSLRSMSAYLGLSLFYAVPLLPFFDSRDITPETLKVSVIAAGFLMLPLLYMCLKITPNGASDRGVDEDINSKAEKYQRKNIQKKSNDVRRLLNNIVTNKPLLIFLSAYMVYGIGGGMWFGLIFLYVDSYLGMGEQFAPMYLLSFILGIGITPVWCKLSILYGKKSILAWAMCLIIVGFIYTGLLRPGDTSLWELILLMTLNALGSVCLMAIAPAMFSEIVDYSFWKYKTENTATYFAIFAFMSKTNNAIGVAIGLMIAGWYGYDATTTSQSFQGVNGLMIAMVWIPVIASVIALLLIMLNPIDANRHGVIRRRLDNLSAQADQSNSLALPNESTSVLHTGKAHAIS